MRGTVCLLYRTDITSDIYFDVGHVVVFYSVLCYLGSRLDLSVESADFADSYFVSCIS